MYYIEIDHKGEFSELNTNEWISKSELFKFSKEAIKDKLNAKAKFKNIEETYGKNENTLTVGFRDTSAFQFQPQSIIANGNTIFYKTESFEHINRLKSLFPLALGYKSYDILITENELNHIYHQEKTLKLKIEDLEIRYNNWKSDVYEYYNEAISLGLTKSDIDIESANVDTIKEELASIVRDIRINKLYKEGSGLRFSEKLDEYETERVKLMRELQTLKMDLNKILRFEHSKNQYLNTVSTEIENRLSHVDWFLKQKGVENCPFCNSSNTKALTQLQTLKDVREKNRVLLKERNDEYLSFDKEKLDLKKDIEIKERKVTELDNHIDVLIKEKSEYYLRYQGLYEYVGRVSGFITNLITPDNKLYIEHEKLVFAIATKSSYLRKLKKMYDKDYSLQKVTKYIKHYIDLLPIENRKHSNVLIDPDKHLGIKIQDDIHKTVSYLNKIGSGSNYMCYHLATMLGLHEYFYKLKERGKTNYIPSFLILDQPSQVYYPERLRGKRKLDKKESEDLQNTRTIFDVCSEFMTRTNNEVQIIILEHASDETWSGISNIHQVEEWRGEEKDGIYDDDYNALIPKDWLLAK